MRLQFDPNQTYQVDAVNAVAGLFDGQGQTAAEITFSLGHSGLAAVPNRLDLTPAQLVANLHAVQAANGISPDARLMHLDGKSTTSADPALADFPNYSVEMETGTGKTYVYIRTALELARRYGFRKYIVVVPSVAIREGALKTLEVTREHFAAQFDNLSYRAYAYDSANLTQVRGFALSDGVEFMVMTLASFISAAKNVLYQSTDRLQGETPVELVKAARPILILDEPQNMESEKSVAALAALNPLFALRYSATHRNPYNLVYRLTPYEAYRQRLVKRIEVASVTAQGDESAPYIRLERVESQKRTLTARLTVLKLRADGGVKPETLIFKPGDSLTAKTGRAEYAGYDIDEIDIAGQSVRFTNDRELTVGEEIGGNRADVFAAQIRYTVDQHLRRQKKLKADRVKVLSLFFIDKVDNYAPADGLIRRLFTEAFDSLKGGYDDFKDLSAAQVQKGYFASRKTKAGEVILEDSTTGEAAKDTEAYDLIMKDKERLLSFDEPTAFIFSHSALREGWDNPNIFQICTLNQSASEMRKRQEVGRGVRLAVDQSGARVREHRVNVLTVVANESYEKYVAGLQSEVALEYQAEIEARFGKPIGQLSDAERAAIAEEYGAGIMPPRPADARQKVDVPLRREYLLQPEFQELWERIKLKTRYRVTVDTAKLLVDTLAELDASRIPRPQIVATKAEVTVTDENSFAARQVARVQAVMDLSGRWPRPNVVEVMGRLLARSHPPVRLTRRTLLALIERAGPALQSAMLANPNAFAAEAVRVLKDKLADQLTAGIKYEQTGEWYEMTQFEELLSGWTDYLVPAERSIYEQVFVDSGVERDFVASLENDGRVKYYVKLPAWFTVPTPIGAYEPDWAVVMEDHDAYGEPTGQRLYLVAETKGTDRWNDLHPDEKRRIQCGKAHFEGALAVRYRWGNDFAHLKGDTA